MLVLRRQEEPGPPWTAKEYAMLRKLYGTMNHPEIAKHLGRTRNAVTGRLQVIGLTKEGVAQIVRHRYAGGDWAAVESNL